MALTAIQRKTVRKALKTADKYHASKKVKKADIEAGLTESQLQPLDHGDRDSEGYLQQRPSQGWGSPKQVRNVGYATKQFVTRANAIEKKYGSAGQLAQAVQRSATPDYFGKKSAQAEAILREFDHGGKSGSSGAKSSTRTVTKTGTVPGKDRSPERQALIQQYFQTQPKPSKSDPYGVRQQGSLLTLASGLKGAQDTPSKTVTVKAKVPGSRGSSSGNSGQAGHYPLGKRGKVIGTPHSGTHTLGNWQSDNAVDIAAKTGTPVYAVSSGTIGGNIGSLGAASGSRFAGLRVEIDGKSNSYWYGHLSKLKVKAGQKVKRGDLLGYSGSANGVEHLHFSQKNGNPEHTVS